MYSIKLVNIIALGLLSAQSLPSVAQNPAESAAQQPPAGTHNKWFGNDMNVNSLGVSRTGLSGGAPASGNAASFAPGTASSQGQMIPMQQFPIENAATSQASGSGAASSPLPIP